MDDACYIGNIFGANIPLVEANFVFVDSSGKLGTTLIDARGNKSQIPAQTLQRTAMLGGQVDELQATITRQQQQIETLTAQLKEQAAQFTAQLKEQAAANPESERPTRSEQTRAASRREQTIKL